MVLGYIKRSKIFALKSSYLAINGNGLCSQGVFIKSIKYNITFARIFFAVIVEVYPHIGPILSCRINI